MSFENNNLDDFFRRKAEAFDPNVNDQNAAWQKFGAMLSGPAALPPRKRFRKLVSKKFVQLTAGLALVTTITWIMYKGASHKKRGANPTAAAQPAIPKQPATSNTPVVNLIPPVVVNKKTTISSTAGKIIKITSDTLMLNRNETPTTNGKQVLAEFYQSITKPVQEFTISNKINNTIRCLQGTELLVPAYALVNEKGQAVKDSVKLAVRECYTYADMLAAGLATNSGDQQLVSGGMVYIEASSGGDMVSIRPGANVQLNMPAKIPDAEMEMFVPERQVKDGAAVNWQPATTGVAEVSRYRIRPYRAKTSIKLFDFRYDAYDERFGTKSIGQFYVAEKNPYSDKQIKEMLKERYLINDEIKLKRIAIDEGRRFKDSVDVVYLAKTGPGKADSMMMPFEKGLKLGLISLQDSINYAFSREADSLLFMQQQGLDSIRFVLNLRADSAAHAKQNALEKNYRFQLKDFGWVNCDKFLNSKAPMIEYVLNIGDAVEADGYTCNLVFKNFKSIVRGFIKDGKLVFPKVPKDEPVNLVAVGMKHGKAVSCIQALKIQAQSSEMSSPRFAATTPEAFRKKVAELEIALN